MKDQVYKARSYLRPWYWCVVFGGVVLPQVFHTRRCAELHLSSLQRRA